MPEFYPVNDQSKNYQIYGMKIYQVSIKHVSCDKINFYKINILTTSLAGGLCEDHTL